VWAGSSWRSKLSETLLVHFERAIHAAHGADATLLERVLVREYLQGKRVWEREVLVFELLNHPIASRCYAWEAEGEVTTVLGVGPVKSALDALRASDYSGTLMMG
jgi:hypothetical protein